MKNIKVLIAEDDFLVSGEISRILKDVGYEVVGAASDGKQAIEMTDSLKPEVILMDIKMPKVNGLEATQIIQQSNPTPVVVMTAHESMDMVKKASEMGVSAYLVKPPAKDEIKRAITIAMARHGDLMESNFLNKQLQKEISIRKNTEKLLLERNEDLDAFSHSVAHDLKNPLGNIMGFAGIIKNAHTKLSDEELEKYIGIIIKSAEKTQQIINSLLLFASVRKSDVQTNAINIGDIVAEAINRLTLIIEKSNAIITFPETWPNTLGYAPWVEEVWVNYLSNAIKYGGTPPQIEMGFDADHKINVPKGMRRFWIRDKGPGISSENQKLLFNKFERLEDANTDGHGLGLSIVRRIIEKLGGKVGVESAIGQGSLFYFTLPF